MSRINISGGRNRNVIKPHHKFSGVYVDDSGDDTPTLYTKKLMIPGEGGQENQNEDYTEWDPMSCKLAASILSGAQNLCIRPGSSVLIIYGRIKDEQPYGRTISHISDIVGPDGIVYVVDPDNQRDLANLADNRKNLVPIVHSDCHEDYRLLINVVDVFLADIHDAQQEHKMYLNAKRYLRTRGHCLFFLKTCYDVSPSCFALLNEEYRKELKVEEEITLERFHTKYTCVVSAYRLLEVAGSIQFNEMPHCPILILNRPAGAPCLPTYLLLELACGYALFLIDNISGVAKNYKAIEEFGDRFDEVYKLVAYHPFASDKETMAYFIATSIEEPGTLDDEFINFIVHNLPTPKVDGQYCYTVAAPANIITDLCRKTRMPVWASLFHLEIARGIRNHIEKIIKHIKVGDLKEAQLRLARNFCRENPSASKKRVVRKKPERRGSIKRRRLIYQFMSYHFCCLL